MRISRGLTTLFSMIILLVLLAVGYLITRPRGRVIVSAEFGAGSISPNADGTSDVATLTYRIRRSSTVSIYFEDAEGERYYFRRDEPRGRGEYSVLFSGIVEGFMREDEEVQGEVHTRLLPDGNYRWVIEATDAITGQVDSLTGTITVQDADPILPDLWEFSISPEVFTPNQDGLNDRVFINAYVPKPAELTVYLIDADGRQYFIPEEQEGRLPGEEGRHSFEWDGGVDLGISPPPDGTYTVLVEARDAEGQFVSRAGEVTIRDGGIPLAEIVGQPVGDTVYFSSETVVVGDLLTFRLTVENYGEAPIRTTGPAPGYIYNQDEVFSSTGYYEESGAWRVGLHCDTCLTDYPWRWALGTPQTLTPIETDGQVHYYLMPGERAIVTGSVRLLNIIRARNPQQFWAGLIHEDVGIAPVNNRVDPHWIEIVLSGDLLLTLTPTP